MEKHPAKLEYTKKLKASKLKWFQLQCDEILTFYNPLKITVHTSLLWIPPAVEVKIVLKTWVSCKVIYPKYSKHWPYTVAHTIDCVCSKMLNHGSNHGLFLSLFKVLCENTF